MPTWELNKLKCNQGNKKAINETNKNKYHSYIAYISIDNAYICIYMKLSNTYIYIIYKYIYIYIYIYVPHKYNMYMYIYVYYSNHCASVRLEHFLFCYDHFYLDLYLYLSIYLPPSLYILFYILFVYCNLFYAAVTNFQYHMEN